WYPKARRPFTESHSRCAARNGIDRARLPTVRHHVIVLRKSKLLNSFPDCPGLCRQFACVICGKKDVPRDMIAQAIRASLFAIATATILGCRRPIRAVSQADGIPCPRRVQRKTA